MREVLLDANLLIGAFDTGHEESKQIVEQLFQSLEVEVAITPLIAYEFFRGAKSEEKYKELKEKLMPFAMLEITGEDGVRAAEIYRYTKGKGDKFFDEKITDEHGVVRNTKHKRSFDLFHCVCAESNQLEFVSQDEDVKKIRAIMKEIPQNA